MWADFHKSLASFFVEKKPSNTESRFSWTFSQPVAFTGHPVVAQGHTENGITTVGLKCHVTIRYVMLVCFKKCPNKRGLPYEGVDGQHVTHFLDLPLQCIGYFCWTVSIP